MHIKHKASALLLLGTSLAASAQTSILDSFTSEKSILDFTAHGNLTIGSDENDAIHGHDPAGDVSLQGIDLGVNVRVNEFLEGFGNITVLINEDDEIDSEFEEGFIKVKNLHALGGSFEARAGRYFNRFGLQNNIHLHGWDFADANLTTGLFLGEEGLLTEGGELSWIRDYSAGSFIISASYGSAVVEDHGEEEGEEDAVEETTENSFISGTGFTVRAQLGYNPNDFNYHTFGVNYANGDNGFDRTTEILSADYQYKWRQNGLEAGGKEWTAGLEYFYRSVEWVGEDDPSESGSTGQQSAFVTAGHTFADGWNIGGRFGYIEGVDDGDFQTEERQRYSLAVTRYFQIKDDFNASARIQYNHTELEDSSSDIVWLQLAFGFGQPEIR